MTNAEYILTKMSDRDLACVLQFWFGRTNETEFIRKVRAAKRRWADSASENKGNMAKGLHGKTYIGSDPSVWSFESWKYPDGTWRNSGRTEMVSWQVWLSEQYDPNDWREDG